jgi:putative oxidoreductase
MDIALFVLRVVAGLFFAGHGAQKLFGSFGGHGLAGTAGFFESLGMRPGRRNAIAAGGAELGAGVLLVLGFLTPVAAMLVIAVMTVAILTVHAKNGPWSTDGGYEYNAILIAIAFALAGTGPGSISVDNLIGWTGDITGTGWAFAALAAGVLGALGALLSARLETEAQAAPEPTRPAPAPSQVPPSDGRFTRDPDVALDPEMRPRPRVPADRR